MNRFPLGLLSSLALAAAGGALWAACLGTEPLELAPWIALVPLLLLLGGPAPALAGWLHGVVHWLVAIPWIAPTLTDYGGLPGWAGWLLLLLLALYLGSYHGLFALLGARIWRRGGAATALLGLPALWVALEWLRAHLFGGFPWNLPAYAVVDVPGALPLAAWVGPYGVSFLLLAVNAALALGLARRRFLPAAATVLAALLALAVGGRWGVPPPDPGEVTPGGAVRILQPNTDNLAGWDPEAVEEGYRRIFRMARRACDRPGVLLVLPESATWPYAWSRDERLVRDLARLVADGCPVLFNSATSEGGRDYNSVYLLAPPGPAGRSEPPERYDKRHLVPWGEYVPLARWLPFMRAVARNVGGFTAGERLELLGWGGEELGPAICFEIVFPAEVAELVRAGATVLVTVTNDAWYGDSSAPHQHLRAARFRAAESRRPVLRAAITGVSALIAPDGRLVETLGVGERGIIAADVAGRRDLSPAARFPWAVPGAASLGALSAIFLSSGRRTPETRPSRGTPP